MCVERDEIGAGGLGLAAAAQSKCVRDKWPPYFAARFFPEFCTLEGGTARQGLRMDPPTSGIVGNLFLPGRQPANFFSKKNFFSRSILNVSVGSGLFISKGFVYMGTREYYLNSVKQSNNTLL